jgi:hypothetical protein
MDLKLLMLSIIYNYAFLRAKVSFANKNQPATSFLFIILLIFQPYISEAYRIPDPYATYYLTSSRLGRYFYQASIQRYGGGEYIILLPAHRSDLVIINLMQNKEYGITKDRNA